MNDFGDMDRAELKAYLLETITELSETGREMFRVSWPPPKKRPLLGGIFGSAGFFLSSCCMTIRGLHQVYYFVVSDHGLFLGGGTTKDGAIEMARGFLLAMDRHERAGLLEKYRATFEAEEAARRKAAAEFEAEVRRSEKPETKVKSIGRRRQRIFDESEGKCHYCGAALTLDGKWHVEHKMPRALGGEDEPGNLVASCVPCNMKKRDTTDLEFRARLAKESAGSA